METIELEQQVIKSIGASGQISLGKEHAGRKVLVENPEQGVWVIRTVTIIPDNESWMHQPSVKKELAKAIDWAVKNPAKASDPDNLIKPKSHVGKRKIHSA